MLYSSQLKSKEMKSFSEFWKSILFFLKFAAMSLVQVKRKCQERLLKQKCEALQEVAKGAPKSTVARKCNVPNNTLSTWIKNKDKIIQFYRECGNVKRQIVRYSPNKNLDKGSLQMATCIEVRMQSSIQLFWGENRVSLQKRLE